ncbi:Na+/H+ antiporter NhaC [Lentibacter sp. XHP0401]|uniref:Na+/H+ antiporter NhaC n=1 Tax=Lentibacter sp. XHP0401 TaxID=2984334 RepID=UPI0021E9A794|nr:Na+/H+ antiporter NhaC [Lentibacter sp. XHP0401]MCV2892716.1 Na+/H+ antiporter NhaC [Lentibacter sp. XHP0401]
MEYTEKDPTFAQAALTFSAIVLVIGTGLFGFGVSLHSLMLICLIIAASSAWFLKRSGFDEIRAAMNGGISGAFGAIYIFILIGVLIASFIQSGTVGALIYYGLQFISPAVFLPAGVILCIFMSIATGTSWGTVGTAGIVLIGIGEAMGIPLPIVAGAVVSGASFGDKMSPVSDTTNLAAMSAETSLYAHIKSMTYTTIPTLLIVLVVFSVISMQYADHALPIERLENLMGALESTYAVNLLCLLPFVVMIALILMSVAAEPAMIAAAASAVLIAIVMQGADPVSVLNALYGGGGTGNTGVETLDNLLARGGITSMMWTLALALMALALGGILNTFGFLRVLIETIVSRVKSAFGLVTSTIVACLAGNMTMGEAYMSIVLGGQLFGPAYDKAEVDRRVLSRSLEEGATLTTTLIPWTTGGAFFATTLGVDVIEYAPWALLNWMNPLVAMLFAMLGIGLFRKPMLQAKTQSD